jgi:flagellin
VALTGTTNVSAHTALRYLAQNQAMASSSLAKLSSGSRIVKASEDAASLAVGTKLKADVTALKQAAVNAGQASSLLQVADGGMARIGDILQRMKALAVQGSSGSVTDSERAFLDQEYGALNTEINSIANQTKFNSTILLNGSGTQAVSLGTLTASSNETSVTSTLTGLTAADTYDLTYDGADTFTLTAGGGSVDTVQVDWTALNGGVDVSFDGTISFADKGLSFNISNLDITDATLDVTATVSGTTGMSFQVGVASADTIGVTINKVDNSASGLNTTGTSITTQTGASTASSRLDSAISLLNSARAGVGSLMSRVEFASANLATTIENLDAARSTLMDVDMASEMTQFTSAQVLSQAGVAMLAQANQMPQSLLKLLQ